MSELEVGEVASRLKVAPKLRVHVLCTFRNQLGFVQNWRMRDGSKLADDGQ